jgi:hypothetical protein
MFRLRIAEWSYQLGCVSAVVAIVYRVLWFGGIGARLFGTEPGVIPHHFVELSILLPVISIACNVGTMVRRQESQSLTAGKAA